MRYRVAYGGIAISTALNVLMVALDLALGRYQAAALQSLVVAFCGVWLWVIPKVDAWLDARLGEATAQRQLAETMLKEVQRLAQTGGLRVGVAGEVTAMRPH